MKPKHILLIAHNFSPELVGMGKYNGEMINWLLDNGFNCTVITTFPYYPFWKVQPPYRNLWYKKEVIKNVNQQTSLTIYRCPSYIPKVPTGRQRTIQDMSFWATKFFTATRLIIANKKFDLIITIAPPFHLAYLGLLIRRVTGGKLLYHIQDLQIEAARDLKLFSNKTLLANLFKAERNILQKADFVSSISLGMIKKIYAKIERPVTLFPNWADTDFFYPISARHLLKLKWGYNPDDIIYLYSGAIGVKQGLECLIAAAEQLKNEKHIKFIICSSGPYKELLVEQVKEKALDSVSFLPLQSKETFNEFLNMADLHLIIQKAGAADLVMPSKLATVLAVGGASIVTALKNTSLYEMVNEFDFGYLVEPGNHDLLSEQILKIKLNDGLEKKRENARSYALKYLNINKVMTDFVDNFCQ